MNLQPCQLDRRQSSLRCPGRMPSHFQNPWNRIPDGDANQKGRGIDLSPPTAIYVESLPRDVGRKITTQK